MFYRGIATKINVNSLDFRVESPALSKTEEGLQCSVCGKKFETPLLAMISSGPLLEEYYACPMCLSKIRDVEHQENVEVDEPYVEEEEDLKKKVEETIEDTIDEKVACAHNFGYLKRRPKNTPIPDECLTCIKMIDCMSR